MYKPKRLHPIAAGFSFIKSLKEWVFPIILYFFFGPGEGETMEWLYFLPFIFIGLLAVYGVLHWYRFTYSIENEDLKIEQGVFIRSKRFIPKKRIQSIDHSEGILHRPFNVVKLRIETAGGSGGAEASLSAVNKKDAQVLVELLQKNTVDTENEEERVVKERPSYQFKLSSKDLWIAASTSGGLGLVLSIVGTFGSQIDNLLPEDFVFGAMQWLSGFSWLFLVIIGVLILIFAWLLSFSGVILKYAGFSMDRYGDRIVIKRGLFEKRELTLPVKRIQGIRIVESIIRQPFGFATVHVESAGGTASDEGVSAMLFPIIKRSKINHELAQLLPEYSIPSDLNALPERSLKRYILKAIFPSLFLISLIWLLPSQWWALLILPVIIFALWGILQHKDGKWKVDQSNFYLQNRLISRSLLITERRRMQHFEVKQSIFQRRAQLATLCTTVLSGGVGRKFDLMHTSAEDAKTLFTWYSRE
ncbi:PH domain-containing protein [Alkalihalobacillus sp. AL-G]|uniref:PH domain-containing protein n=1 Tax=Alkalihalobacillus sp. AL-G TaxID=2926399 RepID=UPI00272BBF41|nr:PH domain-containing protein [Alkalihalobacillus sp. AL-G]WLD93659.1 PH domain-containing protein [Alkalihalobacillus sp. AL-G]